MFSLDRIFRGYDSKEGRWSPEMYRGGGGQKLQRSIPGPHPSIVVWKLRACDS